MKAAESAATELLVRGGEHELQSASAKDSIADCVRSVSSVLYLSISAFLVRCRC
ncbi:unnamed protein product [Dibothriocephalus latus]|uniref:Uncharacterized protein n=1 Tax=Dibothriocephalus latus TaxID=60516 RepID=A0A3P6Q9C6_DIBLA|nr:unnamed protein product [Dibothriocephalus latus]